MKHSSRPRPELLAVVLIALLALPALAYCYGAPLRQPTTTQKPTAPPPAPKPSATTSAPSRVVTPAPSTSTKTRPRATPTPKPRARTGGIGASARRRGHESFIKRAKRDLELARACRKFGGGVGWHCFGVDPHKLEGSIARYTGKAPYGSRAFLQAKDYILAVGSKHLYSVTRRRLDVLIDRALNPTEGKWKQSTELTKQKRRLERLGDIQRTSFMALFFRPDGIGRLQEGARRFGIQQPIVAAGANRLVNTFDRSCADKDRPRWPTICWMADELPSPFVAFRDRVMSNLPLKPASGKSDKAAAKRYVQTTLPTLGHNLIRGWQRRNIGTMRWTDKRTQKFVVERFTEELTKDEVALCKKAPKSQRSSCMQHMAPRNRAKVAWSKVIVALDAPVCQRSTWKALEKCMQLQTAAFWRGYDQYVPPEAKVQQASNVSTKNARQIGVVLILAFVIIGLILLYRRMGRQGRHQQQNRQYRRPPMR